MQIESKIRSLLAKFGEEGAPFIITEDAILINATPHEMTFVDETKISGSTILANIVKATPKETPIRSIGIIKLVKTSFSKSSEGEKFIEEVKKLAEEIGKPILVLSSIIGAQAFGFPVVSPIAQNPRAPPKERRIFKDKFNVFS